jgi:hypothetical protein
MSIVRTILSALGAALAVGIASGSLAQDRPTAPLPASPPEIDCHPAPPPAGGAGQNRPDRGPAEGNPTDKLAQSGGVICPPAEVDRPMQKPVPDVGRTPVIPPPGSPGTGSPGQPR